jgi:hypothetical protein
VKKMIGATVVAALYFAASHCAYAELNCGPMKFSKGESGRNPVAYTNISVENNQWYVAHHMQNGDVYYRQNQYNMGSVQVSARFKGNRSAMEWTGLRNSNSDFYMDGVLWASNGRWWYNEQVLYRGKLVGDTTQDCGDVSNQPPSPPVVTAQAATPPPVPAPAPYTPPASDDVQFTLDNGAMFVSAAIGGRPVTMQVDTGANVCTVPESLANELIASGEATELQQSSSQLADGQFHTFRHISVSTLVVGNHWGKDIQMTVMPSGTPLLSLPVLLSSGNGKFTVDAINRKIIFG